MKTNQKHVAGQQEKVREAEDEMRKNLTSFRNTVAGALLFINLCFFVFAVTLKAYGKQLPGYPMQIPVLVLVSLIYLNKVAFKKEMFRVLATRITSKTGK